MTIRKNKEIKDKLKPDSLINTALVTQWITKLKILSITRFYFFGEYA